MDKSIESNKKFKIKYTKKNGEEVRRFGIITDNCRGFGSRQKDSRPFLHYWDLDKQGYRYATNWEILYWTKKKEERWTIDYQNGYTQNF